MSWTIKDVLLLFFERSKGECYASFCGHLNRTNMACRIQHYKITNKWGGLINYLTGQGATAEHLAIAHGILHYTPLSNALVSQLYALPGRAWPHRGSNGPASIVNSPASNANGPANDANAGPIAPPAFTPLNAGQQAAGNTDVGQPANVQGQAAALPNDHASAGLITPPQSQSRDTSEPVAENNHVGQSGNIQGSQAGAQHNKHAIAGLITPPELQSHDASEQVAGNNHVEQFGNVQSSQAGALPNNNPFHPLGSDHGRVRMLPSILPNYAQQFPAAPVQHDPFMAASFAYSSMPTDRQRSHSNNKTGATPEQGGRELPRLTTWEAANILTCIKNVENQPLETVLRLQSTAAQVKSLPSIADALLQLCYNGRSFPARH